MLTSGIEWRKRAGVTAARLESLDVAGDRATVTVSWSDPGGDRARWSHVLELRDGRIVRMKDAGGR